MIRPLLAAVFLHLCAICACGSDSSGSHETAAGLIAARDTAEVSYREKLAELARWCDEHQLARAAKLLHNWLPNRDPFKAYIFKLPDSFEAPEVMRDGDANGNTVWQRFVGLRRIHAEALFSIAKKAHSVSEYAIAFDLVRQACRENPDHAEARTILGYVRYKGGWALPDTARRLAVGQVYDTRFGWLPAGEVNRYEQGQRYFRGKWISREEDERLHSSIRSGWRIDSEHYAVTTNHSLQEGVRLSRRLETLYDVWRHVFVDYYMPQTQMQYWFKSGAKTSNTTKPAAAPPRRQHQVSYFRNRDEYINTLRPLQPQIDITLGIYFSQPRTAYFFAGDEQYEGTVLHEATHQLFQETRQTGRDVGAKSNFALVEAVACYMESLVEDEQWYTLGGMDQGRVPAARKRLLEDRFYVPLGEVTALGMRELQRDERLPKIYSQISGQALFFLHGESGRYRRPLIETLVAIYTNKDDAATLARTTGNTYEQLDREYVEFMRRSNAE